MLYIVHFIVLYWMVELVGPVVLLYAMLCTEGKGPEVLLYAELYCTKGALYAALYCTKGAMYAVLYCTV